MTLVVEVSLLKVGVKQRSVLKFVVVLFGGLLVGFATSQIKIGLCFVGGGVLIFVRSLCAGGRLLFRLVVTGRILRIGGGFRILRVLLCTRVARCHGRLGCSALLEVASRIGLAFGESVLKLSSSSNFA